MLKLFVENWVTVVKPKQLQPRIVCLAKLPPTSALMTHVVADLSLDFINVITLLEITAVALTVRELFALIT